MSDGSPIRMLTYAELAADTGRSVPSIQKLVRAYHWPRTIGDDGKARIAVPEASIAELQAKPRRIWVKASAPELAPLFAPELVPEPEAVDALKPARRKLPSAKARARSPRQKGKARGGGAVTRPEPAPPAGKEPQPPEVRALELRVQALEWLLTQEREHSAQLRLDRDRWHERAMRDAPPPREKQPGAASPSLAVPVRLPGWLRWPWRKA